MASDDCIWEIKMHPLKPLLATLSSDGFVKLWNINDFSGDSFNNPPKAVVSIKTSAIPTSMDFLHTDLSKMVISYSDSSLVLFDVNTGAETGRFQKADSTYDGTTATQINKVICHQTLPMVITGHEDKHIRFFDPRNEDTVTSMVAHLDAVSCMDISPNGLVLVSGGNVFLKDSS
jgi:striatin 1/3/4